MARPRTVMPTDLCVSMIGRTKMSGGKICRIAEADIDEDQRRDDPMQQYRRLCIPRDCISRDCLGQWLAVQFSGLQGPMATLARCDIMSLSVHTSLFDIIVKPRSCSAQRRRT